MLWKEKYRIGVPQIDEQHEELFKRVNDFVTTLRSEGEWNKKINKVNETLNFMKDYVVEHFRDEEQLQESIGYPDAQPHKLLHVNMVNYVVEISEKYENEGYKEELMQQFAGKLLAWLINHVAASDMKIAEYHKLKELGV